MILVIEPLSILTLVIAWWLQFIGPYNLETVIKPSIETPVITPLVILMLVKSILLQSIAPVNFSIVIWSIVPSLILSPLIWSSANKTLPAVRSSVIPAPTVISPLIVPPEILTLVISLKLQSIGPANWSIVIASIVPPLILSPLIWLSANMKLAALTSNLVPAGTTVSPGSIVKLINVPPLILTFCKILSLKSIVPVILLIVTCSITPSYILLPLIQLSDNNKLLPDKSIVLPSI